MENKGYIHVYTGNGKGKTTAAFGLAIRVLCAGGSVFIGQFVKNMKYNETKIEHLFNNVRIQQYSVGGALLKRSRHKKILTQLMRDWKAANKFSLRESIIWSCSMN